MAYDELHDGKTVRPIFHRYFLRNSRLTGSQRQQALKAARVCVQGDADFLPLVRLMSDREYRELVKGVKQRGLALQKFLHDHYFGGKSYERSGILTGLQVDKILKRYCPALELAPLLPKNIQFWYAPDIIRSEDGKFKVIEDNVGFVGGFGDLEAMAEASGLLGFPTQAKRHPRTFYQQMVRSYRREARSCGGGKIILLSYPKSEQPNHEDQRLAHLFDEEGVVTVVNLKTLKVRADGLFHQGERVGFVIINVNVKDIEPANPASYGVSNFWEAVSEGKVGVSYAPGLEFVGDKEFCPYVDNLIEYYLKQKCRLPSLQTLHLEDLDALTKVAKERQNWVVKLCRGQAGTSVWVGRFMTERVWQRLFVRIKKQAGQYIAQRYCEPSQFLGYAVDLRPLAVVSSRGVQVSPMPWGRAAEAGKAKTNISSGGLLAPVAVVPARIS